MKNTVYYKFFVPLLLSILFTGVSVFGLEKKQLPEGGFTLAVLYEPGAAAAVDKFQLELTQLAPFSELKGWFKVVTKKIVPSELKCANRFRSRILSCDNDNEIQKIRKEVGGNRSIIFLSSLNGGGSDDTSAVIGNNHYDQALHEVLHQIGFADEYTYGYNDWAQNMCLINKVSKRINIVSLDLSNMTFSSEIEARIFLSGKIPWIEKIPASVSILQNGKLGTPKGVYPVGTIGLFQGGACQEFEPSWVAQEYSVMGSRDFSLKEMISSYYADLIKDALVKAASE